MRSKIIMEGMENSTLLVMTPAHKGIFISVWLLAVTFNLLSVIVMGRTVYMKRIWPNIFVFALNAHDLSCLVGGLLPAVIAAFSNQLLKHFIWLCQYQGLYLNVTYISSMTLVACISLDRYAAVNHPFYYNRRMAKCGRAKEVSAILVVVALMIMAISIMPLALGVGYTVVGPGTYCFYDWGLSQPRGRAVAVTNLSAGFLLITIVLYLTIGICARLYRTVAYRGANATYGDPNVQEVYFLKLSVVIGVTVSACTLPLLVGEPPLVFSHYLLLCNSGQVTIAVQQSINYGDSGVNYIVLSVQFLSSAINPILYAAARPATRRGYVELFKWSFYFLTCCWKRVCPSKPFGKCPMISSICFIMFINPLSCIQMK